MPSARVEGAECTCVYTPAACGRLSHAAEAVKGGRVDCPWASEAGSPDQAVVVKDAEM